MNAYRVLAISTLSGDSVSWPVSEESVRAEVADARARGFEVVVLGFAPRGWRQVDPLTLRPFAEARADEVAVDRAFLLSLAGDLRRTWQRLSRPQRRVVGEAIASVADELRRLAKRGEARTGVLREAPQSEP